MSLRLLPNTSVTTLVVDENAIYTYVQLYDGRLAEIVGHLDGDPSNYRPTGTQNIIEITGEKGGPFPARRFTPLAAVYFQKQRLVFFLGKDNIVRNVQSSDGKTWSAGSIGDKKWTAADYSSLAAIHLTNHLHAEFICLYYQNTAETGDIILVNHNHSRGWQIGNPPLNDPPLYGTSIAVVPAEPGIEVVGTKEGLDTKDPVIFFQYDNLALGSSQDQGPDDYATYMPTDQKLALAPRGAIAGVDDGTNFWCFYTTDTNGVYQFRVDAKGAITKPQQVQLDDTPIPRSPLSGVVVKHGKQTKIVLFYLLRHGDVNLFATTLTATTPSATDSWDSSSSVCLNPKPTYPITGIQAGISGQAVPMRYESDTWYPGQTPEHLIQNSLFLHALKKFQARDPAQKLSFFQIGGIHGMPYKPWDEDTKPVTPEEGYCTHDSILFPTWHRPYVMLFEQALYEIMVGEIIPKLPQTQQKAWTDAASTWRLPYWDWAQKKVRQGNDTAIYDIPLIAKEPRIGVYDEKDGVSVIYIDNPMYKFVMPGNKAMGLYGVTDVKDIVKKVQIDIPFEQSVGTSRWAAYEAEGSKISTDWVDGKVDNTKITQALNNHAWYGGLSAIDNVPLAEMVYRLYIKDYISNYTQFATTKYKTSSKYDPDAPSAFLNLEYVHNNIHNWTGGFGGSFTGHMAEVPVAGFDPIFFFHHCNVDRLFALWQDVNQLSDKNWFDKEDDQLTDDGNWSNKEHELDTPLTYLSPFHRDTKSTYFTSDDVRDFKKYGYTYPELQPWLAKYKDGQGNFDVNAYINDVEDQIRNLYSPENASDVGKAQGFTSLGFEKWTKDIIVNITYDRFAFGGVPFTIYLFVGDPSTLGDDDSPLHAKAQLVGYVYTFSNPALPQQNQRGCQACQRKLNEGSKSRAQVPITGALVARLASGHPQLPTGIPPLANLESHSVENYLEKNLHWKVVSHGGHELDIPEDNPFIHVSVYHREARFDDVTNAAQYQHLPTATGSKPGGFIH